VATRRSESTGVEAKRSNGCSNPGTGTFRRNEAAFLDCDLVIGAGNREHLWKNRGVPVADAAAGQRRNRRRCQRLLFLPDPARAATTRVCAKPLGDAGALGRLETRKNPVPHIFRSVPGVLCRSHVRSLHEIAARFLSRLGRRSNRLAAGVCGALRGIYRPSNQPASPGRSRQLPTEPRSTAAADQRSDEFGVSLASTGSSLPTTITVQC
jgi:hypothetical protein